MKTIKYSRKLLQASALIAAALMGSSTIIAIALPGSALADTANVTIADNTFTPSTMTIAPGTTVVWTNNGTMQHTVTADNGSFDSSTIDPNGTFSQTFNSPGTYPYYCKFHGGPNGVGMSGTIVVSDSSSNSNATSTTTSSSASTTPSTTSTSTAMASSTTATSGPVIMNISVVPTDTSANVTWSTDSNSDSQIAYGPDSNYSAFTPLDSTTTMSHSEMITGLSPNTTYHFSVGSRDSSGTITKSSDMTFTTLSSNTLPTTAPPPTSTTPTVAPQSDVQVVEQELAQILQALQALLQQMQQTQQQGGLRAARY